MATISIGKAHFDIGSHDNRSESVGEGFLSNLQRFAASAQLVADKYADYKYNETDWRAIRP
jgi:hypothetical protein